MKTVRKIIVGVNCVFIGLSLLALCARFVPPAATVFFQKIALFTPWIWLIHIIFIALWIVVKWKYLFLSLITLALHYPQSQSFIGFHTPEIHDTGLRIMTFNAYNFNESENLKAFMRSQSHERPVDIFCVQEMNPSQNDYVREEGAFTSHIAQKGKAIYAKHPIHKHGYIQFDQSVNGCLWADVQVGSGINIRVYNLHMYSNRISEQTNEIIDQFEDEGSLAFDDIFDVFRVYGKASDIRVNQIHTILDHITSSPHPVVVCGDFNESPFSFLYHKMRKHLNNSFESRGFGFGNTYPSIPGLKIDYIFADDNFEILAHKIIREHYSDHYPVVSQLKLIEEHP